MPDRLVLPLIALVALAMVALSLVWPQGLGTHSPPPFGHAVTPLAPSPPSAQSLPTPR